MGTPTLIPLTRKGWSLSAATWATSHYHFIHHVRESVRSPAVLAMQATVQMQNASVVSITCMTQTMIVGIHKMMRDTTQNMMTIQNVVRLARSMSSAYGSNKPSTLSQSGSVTYSFKMMVA